MSSVFDSIFDFALEHPRIYIGICVSLGTVLRWYWVGQSVSRFFNPLAPIFM